MTSQYVKNLAEAIKIVADSWASKVRYLSYGTVIFVPEAKQDTIAGDASIDYGTALATNKKNRCPRMLLMSTWADAKFGFVGLHEGVNLVNSAFVLNKLSFLELSHNTYRIMKGEEERRRRLQLKR